MRCASIKNRRCALPDGDPEPETILQFRPIVGLDFTQDLLFWLWLDRIDGQDNLGIKTATGIVNATTYAYEFKWLGRNTGFTYIKGPNHYWANTNLGGNGSRLSVYIKLLDNSDTIPATVWRVRTRGCNTVDFTVPRGGGGEFDFYVP